MNKYYITFSECGQLFSGGWVVIHAHDMTAAIQTFIEHYGDQAYTQQGYLNYAFCYPEDSFMQTSMLKHGNFGVFCREVLYE